MRLMEEVHLMWHVIKAMPNRKFYIYMWYVKMCVTATAMFKHRDHAFSDHLFEMANINVEFEDFILLKESVITSHPSHIQGDISSAGRRSYPLLKLFSYL